MLLAHRGITTTNCQENTLAALEEIKKFKTLHGFNNKLFGIEFDVQQLKTGEIVVYHDETLKRLHNDTRTITQIDKYLATKNNITFLSDVLDSFKNTTFVLDIEIKLYAEDNYKPICNAVANMILKRQITNVCMISCFNSNVIMFFLKNYPTIKSCLIVDTHPSKLLLQDLHRNGMKQLVLQKDIFENDPTRYLIFEPIVYCLNPNDTLISKYPNINIITDNFEKFVEDPKYFDHR
jgi:glycerophosphoryl diester phosphodiesterase